LPKDDRARSQELLATLKPAGPEWVPVHPGLFADECRWFLAAVDAKLITFQECGESCSRLRRSGIPGPDEFATPSGQLRHLYSAPGSANLRLNREYLPHIAAYAYAILRLGYRPERSAFSRYRSFGRDRISKRVGQSYETDVEFYDAGGHLDLQIEVKTWPKEIDRIGAVLDEIAELRRLPKAVAKEVEYVLDLAPRHLWIVGPGTVDPPAHAFRVEVDGENAHFERLEDLPPPPD
jgi:hypothetical protein